MSPDRPYPEEPAGDFPVPPIEIRDAEGETIHIERCSPGDEANLARLVDMYDDFDPADRAQGIPPIGRAKVREWLETVLAQGPDVIASRNAAVIGHATLVPDGSDEFELAIFVHQDHRRRGIGTALLRALLGTAAAAGVEHVWLSVERWNTVAIELYESVGFRTCDSGSFELEMSLRLDTSDS